MDAIIGALALGDIGHLFPDNDPTYEGANSLALCARVAEIMREKGYVIGNVDATVIAQAPKMAPFIGQMRENIASALNTDVENISVKATTEEKLGFTGEGLGISAHAVCLLIKN
jgi:2-C-methyl-D-erythritol 2,4-cyclodiphosphate synthase